MARGIIVIHGIGEQGKGDFLKDVVNPLAGFLESKGGKVDFEPEIALGFKPGEERPAEVSLMVYGPGGGFAEEWRVREAYWAAAFRPPTFNQMLKWGIALIEMETKALAQILDDPLNDDPGLVRLSQQPQSLQGAVPSTNSPKYPPRTERFYRNQAFVFKLVAQAVQKVGRGLLTLVWLLLSLRGLPSPPGLLQRLSWVPRIVTWLRRGVNFLSNLLYPFVVQSLGDVKALLDDPIAADAIRRPFEDAFLDMLKDDDIESISVIAHSLGAAVSYDALTEGRPVDVYLKAHPEERNITNTQTPRHITWITIGAGLNRTYTMTEQQVGHHARERFTSAIAASIRTPEEAFSWVNLYARYDPVPAGPIYPAFFACTQVARARFKERIVINGDNMLNDHTAYWKNDVLVWPRIVQAICNNPAPWPGIDLTETKNKEIIHQRTIDIADRNRRLLRLLSPLMVLGVVVILALGIAAFMLFYAGYGVWTAYRALSWPLFWLLEGLLTGLRRLLHRPSKSV